MEPIDLDAYREDSIEARVNALSVTSVALIGVLRHYTIGDDEEYLLATEQLRAVKEMAGELLETRLGLTRPLDEAKRRIMELFREPFQRLEEAERLLKSAIGTYYALSTEEGPDGGLEASETGLVPMARGIRHRELWGAVVEDFSALIAAVADDRVSESALLPNMPWLNSVARSFRGDFTIPGVRAEQRRVVAAERMSR